MKELIAHFIIESKTMLPDYSHFVKIGGKLGFNEGGAYKDPHTHEKYYIKTGNEDHLRTEHLANQVYEHLGIPTLQPKLVTHKGRVSLASKWRDDLTPIEKYGDPVHRKDLADHLVVGAITMNHDAIGGYDNPPNISYDGKKRIIMHDPGGALGYSGTGMHKNYSDQATEIDSLRNPAYAAGRAFKHLHDQDVKSALRRVLPKFDESHITKLFADSKIENHEDKLATTIARVNYLKGL